MKFKFNKYERVAGAFIAFCLLGAVIAMAGIAIQKGWFASKVEYFTYLESADGIYDGTPVQMAGLRAGRVTRIELMSAQKIKVTFFVFEKFSRRIHKDSHIKIIRPFIIGEKVFELNVGEEEKSSLPPGSIISSENVTDFMDLLSGRTMGSFLGTVDKLMSNLKILTNAFSDEKRTLSLVKIFDQMEPLMSNLNQATRGMVKISRSALKENRLENLLVSLEGVSIELNKILPQMTKESPEMGKQIPLLLTNLNLLLEEFKKLTPAITAIAPELPKASLRAVEALNEAVITLKAMQKSFLLRGNVQEVIEEERRAPANKK